MKRALVLGCGYTGTLLSRRLHGDGVQVVGSRTGEICAAEEGFSIRSLDLLDDGPLSLPEAAGAVVFYLIPTLARDDRGRPHLRPMERCLAALSCQPLRGLIYLSSTSVYGDREGDWVDEESAVSPRSPWGRMRVELEQAVWAFGRKRDVPACVIRAPEIYGPGRGPVERLRRGYVIRCPGRYSSRIHVEDLVSVLRQLGQRLDQRLLLAADSEPATTRTVYTYAARAMGLPEVEELPVLHGDENRRALLQESKRCHNGRLVRWLERPLRYPSYREGITAILSDEG